MSGKTSLLATFPLVSKTLLVCHAALILRSVLSRGQQCTETAPLACSSTCHVVCIHFAIRLAYLDLRRAACMDELAIGTSQVQQQQASTGC